MKLILATILLCLCFSGCYTTPTFQKEQAIPNSKWSSKFQPKLRFELPDSNSIYQPYILIRHDDTYPFMNLWVEVAVKQPGDTAFSTRTKVEIQLADKEGNWLGVPQGSLWEHKIAINPVRFFKFSIPGMYELSFNQLMRVDPLPGILNIGFRLEKYGKN